MLLEENVLNYHIFIIIILYILQGFIQGFTRSIPLYLSSYKASWEQQGTFSWVTYPFSFKIIWAPIIDSFESHRFGRYQTWLIPIQMIIGIILIKISFYFEYLLINLRIVILTIIFFLINFLIASQDIVVDGWSVSLFNKINPQYASTCQTIGIMIGRFIGSTILMTFESANFTNKYIRKPLYLPHQSYGLFSIAQFTHFWGIIFIIVSIIMIIVSLYKNQSNKINNINIDKRRQTKLSLFEVYLSITKLFKKECIQQLTFILLTYKIAFAATYSMTNLTLLGYGIRRDTLALMNIPSLAIHIILPLCLNRIRCPLTWFARGYTPRLILSLILAIYILFTSNIIHSSYFYPVLIILLCLNEILVYLMTVSCVGFYARISEPRIAGTYMTLLATISNLGHSLSSTLVLYIANLLPKSSAYSIEVTISILFGFIWIILTWRMIKRLDALSVEEWYLEPSIIMFNNSKIQHI